MPGRHAAPPAARSALRARLLASTALLPAALLLLAATGGGTARAQALPAPNAGPTGGRVVAGGASITQSPGRTQITQSTDRAAIDWQQFNVGRDHHVDFRQPSAASWTLNRVTGPDPSVIAGRVTSNGGVALVNPSGVVFADGAQVNVGSLIASASNITNENFMAGRMVFDGTPRPGARVENRGQVTVQERGLAALVAPEVRNSGVIRARLGRVALAGAEAFTLDLAGDGLVSIDVTQAVRQAPSGATALVTNSGVIEAEGGSVLLTAHAASGLVETLVASGGRIEAPTVAATAAGTPERTGTVALRAEGGGVRVTGTVAATGRAAGTRGGAVEITGSDSVTIATGARVDVSGDRGGGRATIGASLASARGRPAGLARRTTVERGAEVRADATGDGAGGEVIVHAAERTEMLGTLAARGGPQGGAGGQIEVSSRGAFRMDGVADASAPAGPRGSVLIDPVELHVVDTLSGSTEPGEVTAASISGNASDVLLEATSAVRVFASMDKAQGGLTIRTTDPGAEGVFFDASVIVRGGMLDVSTAGQISVAGGVTLHGATSPTSPAALRLSALGSVLNLGTIEGSSDTFLSDPVNISTAGAIDNRGLIRGLASSDSGVGTVRLNAGTDIDNQATGRIESLSLFGEVWLNAGGAIRNAGAISSTGLVDLFASGDIVNSGTIGASSFVALGGTGAITNAAGGSIVAEGDFPGVLLSAAGPISNAGTIEARGQGATITVSSDDAVANSGSIASLLGASTDASLISTVVRAETSLTNSGSIASDGTTEVRAFGGDVTNSGSITSAGAFTAGSEASAVPAFAALFAGGPDPDLLEAGFTRVEAAGAFVNTGTIAATGTGTSPSGTFFAADAFVIAGSSITNSGTVSAPGNVHLSAGSFMDTSGTIASQLGEVRLYAAGSGLPAGQGWAIRQTAGTIRALGTGSAFDSIPGLVGLTTDAGGVLQTGGAIEARLLAGSAAGAVALDSASNRVEAIGIFRAGTDATTPDEARFTLRTGSPQLAVTGEVSVGVFDNDGSLVVVQRGGTIGLAADDLAIGPEALLRAPDGTVAITVHTPGTHIALARRDVPGGAGRELGLDRAELEDGIRADRLRLGAGPDGSAFPRAGSIRQYADDIDFRSGENVPAAGTAPGIEGRPRTLELFATGAIQQRGRSGDPAAETEGRGPDTADGTRGALRVSHLGGEAGSFAWFGADNGILHLDGFTAGEALTLRNAPGESLGIANPVRVGAGGRITLATDALAFENDIEGMLSAPGGVIEILPVTAGRRVVVESGAPDPSALSLSSLGLGLVGDSAAPTAVLRIGRSEDPAVAGNAAWPVAFAIGRSEVPVGDAGIAGPGPRTAGDIEILAPLSLRSGTSARVGRLELFAGTEGTATGTILVMPDAGIDVAELAGESRRSALLSASGNRIDTLAGFRAGMGATTADQAELSLSSRLDGGTGGADADQPLVVSGEVSVGVRADGSIAREDGMISLTAPALLLQGNLTAPSAADPAATSLVQLEATRGDIIQSGTGRILTGRLLALSARDVLLDAGPNVVQVLLAMDSVTGLLAVRDFRLRVATPFTLAGALTAGRDLGIASDAALDVVPGAQVTAGRDLDLAAGTAMTVADTASIAAPGAVRLTAGLTFAGGGALSAGQELRIEAGSALLLAGGPVSAQTLVARSGGTLRLDGVHFVLGTAALFAAPGGIEAGATSLAEPADPLVLPALLFDTRATTFAAIPGFVQPDVPGLAPEAQATQVRAAGANAPGDFGAATAGAAGPLQLQLDAGSSPVFLLLDGGTASGHLVAGRLGVHGRGGSVGLNGTIAGRPDGTAALTPVADVTRPIPFAERQRYRFNDCVIGSANCAGGLDPLDEEFLIRNVPVLSNVVAEIGAEAAAATGNITRILIPTPPLFQLRRQRSRLADPDVVLPNTIEDDY